MFVADTGHDVRESLFRLRIEEVVDGSKVPLFWRHLKSHIQDQRFQQVQFRVIPERIFHVTTGILQNDVCESLCHELAVSHFIETVPGIAVVHLNQIENFDGIAVLTQVLAHGLIQFGFWICNDQAFPALHCLQDQISRDGS